MSPCNRPSVLNDPRDDVPNATDLMQFGPFVVLVFALLYGAYVIIPKAMDKHEAVVTRIAADHKATVDGLVHEFRDELKEQRLRIEEEHERRDTAIGKLADAVDRIGEKMIR